MPLSASDFASGLKNIKFPGSEAEAAAAWANAWRGYISKATQIAVAEGGVQAFQAAMISAFAPTGSSTSFISSLEGAMRAGLAAVVLIPNYGASLIPAPKPLQYSPAPIDSASTPREQLAEAVDGWTKTFSCSGIPPDFSGAGPLS